MNSVKRLSRKSNIFRHISIHCIAMKLLRKNVTTPVIYVVQHFYEIVLSGFIKRSMIETRAIITNVKFATKSFPQGIT